MPFNRIPIRCDKVHIKKKPLLCIQCKNLSVIDVHNFSTNFIFHIFLFQFLLLACLTGVQFTLPDFSSRREIRLWRSVSVMGEGLLGLASTACLVVLLKQKHSRGFKNYQMAALSLSEPALLQPYVSGAGRCSAGSERAPPLTFQSTNRRSFSRRSRVEQPQLSLSEKAPYLLLFCSVSDGHMQG